jgi:hypothetical protein
MSGVADSILGISDPWPREYVPVHLYMGVPYGHFRRYLETKANQVPQFACGLTSTRTEQLIPPSDHSIYMYMYMYVLDVHVMIDAHQWRLELAECRVRVGVKRCALIYHFYLGVSIIG